MRYGTLVLAGWTLVAISVSGCSESGSGGNRTVSATAATSAASVAPPAPVFALEASGSLGFELRAKIARDFAPQLRFNAFHNDGNTSPQNRNEDFFPIGIASLLKQLNAQQVRRVTLQSSGTTPALVSVESITDQAEFGGRFLGPYPRFIAGDSPGTAPLYTNVYPDDTTRQLDAQRAGTIEVYCEYHVFYAQDRAEASLFGLIPTSGDLDLFGHRGDWERIGLRTRLSFGPGGVYQGGEVLHGVFSGHGKLLQAERPEIETVDDQGVDDPQGTHLVVYVANGKHAAFPQAGEWKDANFPDLLGDYTDFFRGNGVWIDGWKVPLLDLEEPGRAPDAFAPPEFLAMQTSAVTLLDWTEYDGAWGPDLMLPLGIRLPFSPWGPKLKREYGKFGGNTEAWIDAKNHSRLVVYKDVGRVIPRANPIPYPN